MKEMKYELIKQDEDSEIYACRDGSGRAIKVSWGDVSWGLYYAHLDSLHIVDADAIARYGSLNEAGEFVAAEYDDDTKWWSAPEGSLCWDEVWLASYAVWVTSLGCSKQKDSHAWAWN